MRVAGFTLLELTAVLAILVIVAGIAFFRGGATADQARADLARLSLATLRDAVRGAAGRPGFRDDVGELPGRVSDLIVLPEALPSGRPVTSFDPLIRRGWNGPYVDSNGRFQIDLARGFTVAYEAGGAPAVLDPWGHPIVLQRPDPPASPAERERYARLVSAGPDGVIQTSAARLNPDPSQAADVGDDVVLYLSAEGG